MGSDRAAVAKAGVWLKVFKALAAASLQSLQLIDSSIVRAHQHVKQRLSVPPPSYRNLNGLARQSASKPATMT
jgi:hypothetical protein